MSAERGGNLPTLNWFDPNSVLDDNFQKIKGKCNGEQPPRISHGKFKQIICHYVSLSV